MDLSLEKVGKMTSASLTNRLIDGYLDGILFILLKIRGVENVFPAMQILFSGIIFSI